MNKILSKDSFEKIMMESTMKATKDFAKKIDCPFSLELLLVMYSADLASVVHARLFEEVRSNEV